jgi:ABC-type bacteriocin/lantibiotic exporter with double-glycine peptidase domain
VVGGVFLSGLFQVNQMKLIEKVQQKLFVRYSLEFSDRIPKLDIQKLDGKYLPELVNRFFDTISLQKGISKLLLDIPAASIQILFGLLLLSFYHPVFIFFGLTLVTLIYLILKTTSAKGMESSHKESDFKYKVAGWLEEMARVINSFKFSRSQTLTINKTDKLVTGYLDNRTIHFRVLLKQYWTLIAFKIAITAAMLIVGSILLVNQQLNIGQFIAAEIVILMVINSVEKLIMNIDSVYDVLTAVEKLAKVTEMPVEQNGMVEFPSGNEGLSIEIKQLRFDYTETKMHPVFDHLSLDIVSNEKVCLMGRAGSGKSTLLRLLTGAFRDFEGNISINQVPIVNYKMESLRSQMGILLSQQDIFEGTLFENISMGNQAITVETIMATAEKVGLKDYLSNLPDGLMTHLDPAGKRLSEKVVKKILLVRALVNHPRLVLLEEPFEGIEDQPKQSIINFLFYHSPNQTILISSNDIEFAAKCDKVIFLEEGKIKAIGKWASIAHLIKH